MNTTDKTIGIIGLGPVGMTLAVHLQDAGCNVIICDNDPIKTNRIRNEGILLENVIHRKAKFNTIYSTAAELLQTNPDYVIIALKTYQVDAIIKDVPPENTSVFICAQNGIDVEDIITAHFGESRVMRMVINFAGNMTEPNTVRITFFNAPNYIAALEESGAVNAIEIANFLNSTALDTEPISSFELTKRVWKKQF
jgi:ketopantoate reductase